MPPRKPIAPVTEGEIVAPKWTHEQLKSVKHLGPSIIGAEMFAAAQAFDFETKGGKYGPALLDG